MEENKKTTKSTNKNVKKSTTKKVVKNATATKKGTTKKVATKSSTTKKVTPKKSNTKKSTTKKVTPKKSTTKTTPKKVVKEEPKKIEKTEVKEEPKKIEETSVVVKEEKVETKKIEETKVIKKDTKKDKDIDVDINKYVNVLFDRKEEKAKSIISKIFIFIIIVSIIGMGVLVFLDKKDEIANKFFNNEHVKRVMNKRDEEKPKKRKKPEVIIEDTDKIAILTFHRITTDETKKKYFSDNEWVESIDMFDKQMKYLYDNGYKTLNLDEFNCWYDKECKFDKKTVVLTFDDGDLSFYYLVAPVLKKYNFKATMFVVGSRTTDKEQAEFSDTKRLFIAKETIEKSKQEYPNIYYESHSYNFHDSNNKKKAYAMTRVQLQEDFDNMKSLNTKYIAYPFGIYDEALLEKTEQNGYVMGFTFKDYDYATRNSKRFEIPRFKINGESNVETIEKIVNY